ncbi:MAG: hypothetical protein ACRDTU_21250 [Micromonosporaceae bacterium]
MLSVAILAPVLPRGFVLVYDMSFVPHQPLHPDSLGLGGGLPRAVPADALVAVATTVIPGDILQKLVLFGTLFAAALGAARLSPGSTLTRCVAAVAYTWNAFIAERLLIGQWGLLVAYAALPWILKTALELRERSDRRQWARLVLVSLPAVITPTGGLLAAGAALAVAGRRRLAGVLGVAAAMNAPWWLPAVLHPGAGGSDPDAVAAFAARGEGWAPAVLSVLGLGGIWNAEVVPASRGNPVLPLFTLLIVGLAAWGTWLLIRRWGAPARGLAVLAGAGLVVAIAGTLPGLSTVLEWAVGNVPGAGLLRDGQKWTAWWALLSSLGFALACEALGTLSRDRLARVAVGVGALLLPIAILPDLVWGAAGRLEPVSYPADWQRVSRILADDPRPGEVLSAPPSAYRRFSFNGGRTQYDPAPRYLPRPVVVADELRIGATVVRGEDTRAARVVAAAAAGEPLGRYGIGWVLVARGTPGPSVDAESLTRVYDGESLTLYRVGGRVADPPGWSAATPWVLTVDAAVTLLLLLSALSLLLPSGKLVASRRRASSRATSHREGER